MFVEDVVYFFVEREQVVVHHLHTVACIQRLFQVVELAFARFRSLVDYGPGRL